MRITRIYSIPIIICILFVLSCSNYSPKPKAYPKINYPESGIISTETDCPFSIQIPRYSELVPYPAEDKNCWYNINFNQFDATLHLSYIPIKGQNDLDSLTEDAYKLVFKPHLQRAEEIIEREISDTIRELSGMIYDLQGKTATPFNFFISDGQNHFLRGSFYFNSKTKRDSVLPIYNFINKDILKTIKSIQFK
jgi:gliding motility-associated lipoprotein GldD